MALITDEAKDPVPTLDCEDELNLLTELRPWGSVFAENLADTVLHRKPPHYYARYRKAEFWNDVFVPGGVPWARMRQSGLLHVFVVVAIWGLTQAWMLNQRINPQVRLHPVIHYDLSEYLPPMDTGSPPAPKPRKGQPLLAKQKVISLQPNADNHEQTIITPADVKLPANLPLPNIVAWTETPGVPTAAAVRQELTKLPNVPVDVIAPAPEFISRDVSKLKVADATPKVVEAAPEVQGLQSNRRLDAQTNVIEPPPTADLAKLTRQRINAPTPSVVEAPPDANISRKLGELNVAKLTGTALAPKIQLAEQRAVLQLQPGRAGSGAKGASGSVAASGGGAPPINPVGGMNTGVNAGQLIALNLHPAIPNGPIVVPPGRRSGEFAAGPEGTTDAPGTPEIKGGGTSAGGNGTAKAGAGKGDSKGLPAGITIGNAPGAPPPGSVVVAGDAANHANSDKQVLMAEARPPRVGETVTVRGGAPDAPKIEDRVFAGKPVYTLAMNMPNLTSSGGSWIIRFAQLDNDKSPGAVSAPVATSKVDPAYPAALLKDGVEGTVILYAVIHKDGTVGDVRVLRGVQGRLDESARSALARWKFRPGTKNGEAVDLEAVVQIPFKAPRWAY